MSTLEAHTKTKRAPERSRRVPELRFPEFDGEWKKERLEELAAKIQDGTHFSPEILEEGLDILQDALNQYLGLQAAEGVEK